MAKIRGYIHNGTAQLPLISGAVHAQFPINGGGPARFGAKELDFNESHFRLFDEPTDLIALPRGVCLTVRTRSRDARDLLGARLPASPEAARLASLIRLENRGPSLPIDVGLTDTLRRLEAQLAHDVDALSRRIGALPGRSQLKRVDTFLRLERARDYIETHFAKDPSTQVLAERAAISRAHFIRLFGAFYGISPKQRVLEFKVEEAKRLLRETRLSIWEVAEASGFGNRCAFQRMFRDRVGVTPGTFRATHRGRGTSYARDRSAASVRGIVWPA